MTALTRAPAGERRAQHARHAGHGKSPRGAPSRLQAEACERCSGAARVRILEGYRRGRRVIHSVCLACAEDLHSRSLARGVVASVAHVAVGAAAVALALFAAL